MNCDDDQDEKEMFLFLPSIHLRNKKKQSYEEKERERERERKESSIAIRRESIVCCFVRVRQVDEGEEIQSGRKKMKREERKTEGRET